MNLPNKLTFLRILMVPLILVFLMPLPSFLGLHAWNAFVIDHGRIVALILFSLASYTDYLDGVIARRQNLVTSLGKFLDPIADKMLVISVFIALVQMNRVNALVPIVVIIRELTVSSVRMLAAEGGKVVAANNLGKAKTVSQIVAIMVLLAEPLLLRLTQGFLPEIHLLRLGDAIVWLSVVLTLLSGIGYVRQNLRFFREA